MNITPARRPRIAASMPLLIVLLLALALRLLLWGRIPRTGLISDEGEYLSAANWLAQGRSFSWYQSYLWTRAPIYPLFVAAHLRLFGDTLTPIYVTQTALSLLNSILVYLLAQRFELKIENEELKKMRHGPFSMFNFQFFIPPMSALLMAIYLPFALYTQMLLSETLFITLLLAGFLALAIWVDHRPPTTDIRPPTTYEGIGQRPRGVWSFVIRHWSIRHWSLVVAGGLFGLATLTRSLTLAFLPLAALWVAGSGRSTTRGWWRLTRRGALSGAVFLACAGALILPWTVYNSSRRLYDGLVIVDTSGAFNLLLGARTAYDGGRNDAATRDFVLVLLGQKKASELTTPPCTPLPAPLPSSQAARQSAMTREGLCLIGANPLAFIQKSLGELVDLFQINYTGAERFANSFSVGRLPRWYTISLFLLDDTIYVLVLPLAVIGWALLRRTTTDDGRPTARLATQPLVSGRWSVVDLIGCWLLYNIAVAPLLFAINRFRLPLLPFAFIFTAYALAALLGGGWRALRSRYGVVCAALAGLLALAAATPYAYLEPRPNGEDSRWASYLGPYPSSIAATGIAWRSRPGYLIDQRVMHALGSGDAASARALVQSSDVMSGTLQIGLPLLAGLEGRAADGLALLPSLETIIQNGDVKAAVARGELLRRLGDWDGARFILTQRFVDDANPVQWAWDWLHPVALPNNQIDLAGNLDLGYIEGCYLGEGDSQAKGNFRWCTDGARLRFPAAGTGAPQMLALRADGRGWLDGLKPPSTVHVLIGDQEAGIFTPESQAVGEFQVILPPSPAGADVVVTLHMDTFVPGADRYLSQQGKPVVGQVQRLGVRLDWAELRNRN
jgi:hypothetical protein